MISGEGDVDRLLESKLDITQTHRDMDKPAMRSRQAERLASQ